jgi:hypothetical protein
MRRVQRLTPSGEGAGAFHLDRSGEGSAPGIPGNQRRLNRCTELKKQEATTARDTLPASAGRRPDSTRRPTPRRRLPSAAGLKVYPNPRREASPTGPSSRVRPGSGLIPLATTSRPARRLAPPACAAPSARLTREPLPAHTAGEPPSGGPRQVASSAQCIVAPKHRRCAPIWPEGVKASNEFFTSFLPGGPFRCAPLRKLAGPAALKNSSPAPARRAGPFPPNCLGAKPKESRTSKPARPLHNRRPAGKRCGDRPPRCADQLDDPARPDKVGRSVPGYGRGAYPD